MTMWKEKAQGELAEDWSRAMDLLEKQRNLRYRGKVEERPNGALR